MDVEANPGPFSSQNPSIYTNIFYHFATLDYCCTTSCLYRTRPFYYSFPGQIRLDNMTLTKVTKAGILIYRLKRGRVLAKQKENHISLYSPASVKSKLSTPIYVYEFERDTSDLQKIPLHYTLFFLFKSFFIRTLTLRLINQNFKNVLRTFLRNCVFILIICILSDKHKIKETKKIIEALECREYEM